MVVLPAPLGPRNPVTDPFGTVKERSTDGRDRPVALHQPSHLEGAGASACDMAAAYHHRLVGSASLPGGPAARFVSPPLCWG